MRPRASIKWLNVDIIDDMSNVSALYLITHDQNGTFDTWWRPLLLDILAQGLNNAEIWWLLVVVLNKI